uniref:HYR domain-containing protein n=1 Tax=Mariniphaga sediminis TaxID=1628158 RepID=UPI003568C07F
MKKTLLVFLTVQFLLYNAFGQNENSPGIYIPGIKTLKKSAVIPQVPDSNPKASTSGTIVLSFEGLNDMDPINEFYNGGTSGSGNTGTDYGISFTADALAIIDADDGGSGNFANEPSPSTIMFFVNSDPILNLPAGFTTGFSFYYCSAANGVVEIYDDLNGTGNLIGSYTFASNNGIGAGDPTGDFANWEPVGVPFNGVGKSIIFEGVANQCGFDDITFGSISPGQPTCPDIVADNDPGTCGAVVTYDAPAPGGAIVTQVDNSGLTSGDLFPVGETVQEYELDFGEGGKDTCSFTVTVNDVEPPVPTCPANITTGNDPGEDGALVWYASTQNFTGPFAPENWDLVTNGGNGYIDLSGAPTQITLWGSNDSGASSPDTEYKITIPTDGTMSFDWDYLTFDVDGPSYDPFGYSINGVFTQLTADNGSDTQNGSISIPLNQGDVFAFVVQTTDDGMGPGTSTMVSFSFDGGNVDISDNCPGATIEADHENGSFFPFGETVVILTATDASGNMATCSFTVTVVDIDPPVAVANPIEVVLDETGKYTLTPEDLEEMAQGSTDNFTASGDLKLSAYPKIFVCDNVGETMHVRLTVEDENGNTDWQWTTVTVLDTLPPAALCQDIEVYLDENGEASITPEDVAVSGEDGSYDACGIVSLELDKETFGCA